MLPAILMFLFFNQESVAQNLYIDSEPVKFLKQKNEFDQELWKKTIKIFNDALFIDCHSHQPFKINSLPEQRISSFLQSNKQIGIIHAFPLRRESKESISDRIINDIAGFKRQLGDSSYNIKIIEGSSDFSLAAQNHQVPVLIHIESFEGLAEGNISNLQRFHDAGVRMIGFNQSGLDTVWRNNILTDYGISLVKELNRLGIICDITHVRRTIQNQVIELSNAPVIISHGAASAIINSEFNTPDSLLRKMASKGGMIGITFFSGQLSRKTLSDMSGNVAADEISRASIDDFIDQVDYLKSIIGIDHIGIGTDYGGSGKMSPQGLEKIDGIPLIIYYMLKRNYSEQEIRKVLGLNFIDFFIK